MEPKKKIDEYGIITYALNGKLHNEDGPAIEYPGGSKQWYKNGKRHRLGGPACEFENGSKYWYINGKNYNNELEYWIAVQKYIDTH